MDHIDWELSKYSHDKKYVHSIRTGISLAKETLNCYYSHMDETKVYHIAMGNLDLFTFVAINWHIKPVLHPRHKLSYFKTACWEDKWITTPKTLSEMDLPVHT